MKEMLPYPCLCKGTFEWIMGVRQAAQAAQAVQAVILALHQVVYELII
jgi:hypothetical protein